MSFIMPRIEKDWFSEEEWNRWMFKLIDHRGFLRTGKPFYSFTKDSLIIESVFIKLMEYLYRHPKLTTPFYSYDDPFYNQVEKNKERYSLSEHIEITACSWGLTFKTLKHLY